MTEKNEKELEKKTTPDNGEPAEEEKPGLFKASVIIVLAVMAVFLVIVSFTGFLGNQFGKTAENAVLILIALILGVMFIRSKKH
ncbi:MAG: hypothetical protein ACI4LA_07545 [Emergencia sp.]